MQEYQDEHKDADGWLEQLKECKQLSEHSVKLLCDKASAESAHDLSVFFPFSFFLSSRSGHKSTLGFCCISHTVCWQAHGVLAGISR